MAALFLVLSFMTLSVVTSQALALRSIFEQGPVLVYLGTCRVVRSDAACVVAKIIQSLLYFIVC